MTVVNVQIGPVVFDHADYDAQRDVLYLHLGTRSEADERVIPQGHVVRYAPGTGEIIELTLVGPANALERDGCLPVTLPGTGSPDSHDLAPAISRLIVRPAGQQRRIWGNLKGVMAWDFDEIPEEFAPYM